MRRHHPALILKNLKPCIFFSASTKLGHPALARQRKERSLRKQAALLGFSLQPADAGAVS